MAAVHKIQQNPKVQQLMTTAGDLFMKHGIRRVSIAEICSEAGVSKVTFYKYFENKNDLVKKLLNEFFASQMKKYREIMAQSIPYSKKVRQIIQLKDNETQLMSREFFADIWKNPEPEIMETLNDIQEQSLAESLRDLRAAQEKGEIRGNLKPEFILYFLNHINEMVRDEKLLKLYASPNELAMELTNFFFYGILNPGDDNDDRA